MVLVYSIPTVRSAWGDTSVPTTDIVDPGNTYESAGWQQSTTPPPRQYFNFVLNQLSTAIRYFMQNGIVDWQTGELYQTGAIVVFNNFVFQSLVNSNTGVSPPAPGGTNANWGPISGYATIAMLANLVTTTQLNTALASYAALNSPTFTGTPLTTTPATNDSSTKIADTAFTQAAIAAAITALNLAAYLTIAAAQGYGANRLPAGIYRNSLGSGVVTIQQGGAPSGGSPGDMFLIY